MTKFLSYLIIAVGLLAAASWLTAPAQAHVPKAGDQMQLRVVCKEDAHNVLIEIARTEGLRRTSIMVRRFLNGHKCFSAMPLELQARVVEVIERIDTPDGFILYSLRVQPIDGDREFFAAHTHKVEGQET